ncbi:hypothetical protein J6590_048333 [Homalodisca vitripennis]|nr:hypothetical protein J6590_048333 [Homalodisca vitripennis]
MFSGRHNEPAECIWQYECDQVMVRDLDCPSGWLWLVASAQRLPSLLAPRSGETLGISTKSTTCSRNPKTLLFPSRPFKKRNVSKHISPQIGDG